MIATMFQVGQSIQIMLGSITEDKARSRFSIVIVALYICAVGFIFGLILFSVILNYDTMNIFWVYTIYYLVMTVVFTFAVSYANRMIGMLYSTGKSEDFTNSKQSVKMQFTIFLIAFVSRWVFFMILILDSYIQESNSMEEEEPFWASLTELILYIPWNVVPVLVVLYEHHRTFKNLRIHRNEVSMSDIQVSGTLSHVSTTNNYFEVKRELSGSLNQPN